MADAILQEDKPVFCPASCLNGNATLLLGSLTSQIEEAITKMAQSGMEDVGRMFLGAMNYLGDQAYDRCLGALMEDPYKEAAQFAEKLSVVKAENMDLIARVAEYEVRVNDMMDQGKALSSCYLSLAENMRALEYRHYTSGRESGIEIDEHYENESDAAAASQSGYKRWLPNEVLEVLFIDPCEAGFKEEEPPVGPPSDSKGSNTKPSTKSQEKPKRTRCQPKAKPEEEKIVFNPKKKRAFVKKWTSRHKGDRGITIDQISEHEFSMPDEKDAPIGIDGKPMRRIRYEEDSYEIIFVEKVVVRHIFSGVYVDDAADRLNRKAKAKQAAAEKEKEKADEKVHDTECVPSMDDQSGYPGDGAEENGSLPSDEESIPVLENLADEENSTVNDEWPVEQDDDKEYQNATENKGEEAAPSFKVFHSVKGVGKIFANSLLSPSLMAAFLYFSFCLGIPIYRFHAWLISLGMCPAYSTVVNWKHLAARALRPLADALLEDLKTHPVIQGDESPGATYREEGREDQTKSYFFFYTSIREAIHRICIAIYHPGRSGEFIKEDLGDYKGKITTDAYSGYNILGLIRGLCNNHARRKFFYASKFSFTKYQRDLAKQLVKIFDDAQKKETQITEGINKRLKKKPGAVWTDADFAKRKKLCKKDIEPLMDKIHELCMQIKGDPLVYDNSLLMRAVNYYLNGEEGFRQFLEDGRIPFHNMLVEQTIKKYATRRRGVLFNGSPKGAESDAVIMTVVYTLEMNDLDVKKYLTHYFEVMRGKKAEEFAEMIPSLLPWSEDIRRDYAANINPRNRDREFKPVGL